MYLLQRFMTAMHNSVQMKLDENNAKIRLVVCVRQDQVDYILEEVDRRTKLFKRNWRTSKLAHDKTARHAALDSVYNDVVRGYLI